MNQGIAFARTIRALEADDFPTSELALLGVAVFLGAWVWWGLAARVPQYEFTTNVQLAPGGALAYFPARTLSRIHAGQPAFVHTAAVTLSAKVAGVASEAANGTVRVVLELPASPQSPVVNPGQAQSAEVEVARIAPAALALRLLGRANR